MYVHCGFIIREGSEGSVSPPFVCLFVSGITQTYGWISWHDNYSGRSVSAIITGCIVDIDGKYERRRGASLPASSVLKEYDAVLRNNF